MRNKQQLSACLSLIRKLVMEKYTGTILSYSCGYDFERNIEINVMELSGLHRFKLKISQILHICEIHTPAIAADIFSDILVERMEEGENDD